MRPAIVRKFLHSAFLLLPLLFTGCQSYRERFTYFTPDGSTNHIVDVRYQSFLMWGKAARLKTETQTQEFIRTVNADGLEWKPDAESLKAITEGISAAILKTVKPVP